GEVDGEVVAGAVGHPLEAHVATGGPSLRRGQGLLDELDELVQIKIDIFLHTDPEPAQRTGVAEHLALAGGEPEGARPVGRRFAGQRQDRWPRLRRRGRVGGRHGGQRCDRRGTGGVRGGGGGG